MFRMACSSGGNGAGFAAEGVGCGTCGAAARGGAGDGGGACALADWLVAVAVPAALFAFVLFAIAEANAALVPGPKSPSAAKPWSFWKFMSACLVPEPM